MSIYVLGLDLGQAQDYTAAVIIEASGTAQKAPFRTQVLGYDVPAVQSYELAPLSRVEVQYIKRFDLGTRYQEIAGSVAAALRKMPMPRYLAVDQTGVGRGVLEMLYGCRPVGITITAGNEVTPGVLQHEWRVPKRDLVSTMQVLFQNRQFGMRRDLPHSEVLDRELRNFRAKISASGHETYEAWREKEHDDLVLACALACWLADQTLRLFTTNVREAVEASYVPSDYQISPI